MPSNVVVITGANNGIGLGLAQALSVLVTRVACLDLSGENLPDFWYLRCDVSDPAQTQDATAAVIAKWGQLDVLVNNACLAVFAPFEEKDLGVTRREFDVNYFGYTNMIRAVLPQMKAQRRGVIHNVSSTVGTTGFAGISGYASTKGAIEALSRTLAIEFAPYGIVVNIIHPPLTRTKSSAPLGVPPQMMADPVIVGRKLAKKISSSKPVITPGPVESLGVFMARLMPGTLGRFLSTRAAVARETSVAAKNAGA